MKDTMVHPVTGRTLQRGVRPTTYRYRGLERTVEQPGWWPEDDSDGILVGVDMEVSDQALHEMKAEFAASPKPEEVRRVREHLKLSQRRAGELLGGGPRAFQKYESGEVAVSRPMANLLKLLDREPARLQELIEEKATS
jgi:HTH-type transcriptional regulator/antitoxin MqsA